MYLFKATENSRVLQSGLNELTVSAGLRCSGSSNHMWRAQKLKAASPRLVFDPGTWSIPVLYHLRGLDPL